MAMRQLAPEDIAVLRILHEIALARRAIRRRTHIKAQVVGHCFADLLPYCLRLKIRWANRRAASSG
jgi:hypothetical protein